MHKLKLDILRMYKYYRYIIVFIIIFLFIAIFIWVQKINNSIYLEDMQKKVDESLQIAINEVEVQKEQALSIAVLTANKETIIDGYKKNDRKKLFRELESEIKTFEHSTKYHYDIQLHTEDVKSYVCSWDFNSTGMELKTFRQGILKVKSTKKPIVGIELGKRLNIKAIAPIFSNNVYIGSVEAIIGFDKIEEKLKKQNIIFCVLLNEKYISNATLTKRFDKVNGFAQITDGCKGDCLKSLSSSIDQIGPGIMQTPNFDFGFIPFYDYQSNHLGYIGVALEKRLTYMDYFNFNKQMNHHIDNVYLQKHSFPIEINGILIK